MQILDLVSDVECFTLSQCGTVLYNWCPCVECKVSKLGVNERSYLAPAELAEPPPPSDGLLIFKLAKFPSRFGKFQQTLSELQSGHV